MAEEYVGRNEHDMLIKNLNGNLERIDRSIETLGKDNRADHKELHQRLNNIEEKRIGKGSAVIITVLSCAFVSTLSVFLTMIAR